MSEDAHLGFETAEAPRIIVDYGGANVAKPLHVGHLHFQRSSESIKRIGKLPEHHVIVMCILATGIPDGTCDHGAEEEKPELPYFDESFEGEYPEEAPFYDRRTGGGSTYPTATSMNIKKRRSSYIPTSERHRGYRAVWKHIMNASVADLKKNYGNLNVDFDLWKGEQECAGPDIVRYMKREGLCAYINNGALVRNLKEEIRREIPPCVGLLKIRRSCALWGAEHFRLDQTRSTKPDE